MTTLPNTGTLTGTTVSQAEFVPITMTDLSSVNGTNLDVSNGIGVAFSYSSPNVVFFNYSPTATSLSEVGYFATNSNNSSSLGCSGCSGAQVAGVVLDPTNETAIVDAADGYEIWSYTTPTKPTWVKTIPSANVSSPSTLGIDMAENFAYDPNFTIGTSSYRMILSGGDAGINSQITLELADANTGTIYVPDSATTAVFTTDNCVIDQIGIDTSYQVAVMGCEYNNNTQVILVNLNAITLNPPASGSVGTYTLPATAILSVPTGSAPAPYDNVAVESNTHTVFILHSAVGVGNTSHLPGL